MSEDDANRPPQAFPATRWTLVFEAQAGEAAEKGQARDYLCKNYWYPIYAYARRCGIDSHDAEDLTQGFFARFFGNQFDKIEFEKRPGRLRSYLLKAFKNFIYNDHRRNTAQKRGGELRPLSLDAEAAENDYRNEPHVDETPESLFERRWALSVMEAAFEKLEADYIASGKLEVFKTLKDVLAMPDRLISFAEIGEPIGMSAGTARVGAFRMRQKLKVLIRKEIEYTVDTTEEADEELRHLRSILAG